MPSLFRGLIEIAGLLPPLSHFGVGRFPRLFKIFLRTNVLQVVEAQPELARDEGGALRLPQNANAL